MHCFDLVVLVDWFSNTAVLVFDKAEGAVLRLTSTAPFFEFIIALVPVGDLRSSDDVGAVNSVTTPSSSLFVHSICTPSLLASFIQ